MMIANQAIPLRQPRHASHGSPAITSATTCASSSTPTAAAAQATLGIAAPARAAAACAMRADQLTAESSWAGPLLKETTRVSIAAQPTSAQAIHGLNHPARTTVTNIA